VLLLLFLLAPVAGAVVYCILIIVATYRYRRVPPPEPARPLPMSILKPLSGIDEGLEENLRTFFEQDYPAFEILFAVREVNDPAVSVVRKLQREYASVPSRLIFTGEPPYPNAKVFSLDQMMRQAAHDLLVMSDSDVRVTPGMLNVLSAELQGDNVALVTCPYRAAPGKSFWSRLEGIGLNTEFIGGVLVARMLDGMKFAIGPTIAARRQSLERIGGFNRLKDYLAEDFVMGKLLAETGECVILSSYVIEHRIGSQDLSANLRHRLRWNRSTRRSRPWGYVGQAFTNPLPLALIFWAAEPAWWPVAAITVFFRAVAGWITAEWVLRDPLTRRSWWLVPVQDIASFLMWMAGFFGNTILWRGRTYRLLADGTFELQT